MSGGPTRRPVLTSTWGTRKPGTENEQQVGDLPFLSLLFEK